MRPDSMLIPRFPPILVALLGAALAGCAGNDSEGAEATPSDDASGGEILNAIQGQVTTADLYPLSDVSVEILSLNLSLLTNSEGQYRFENLEPRDYLVTASKEGYRTLTQRAVVQDGQIFELNFPLDERPLQTPYNDLQNRDGRISCDLVYGTNPENMDHQDCGFADPSNAPVQEFLLNPGSAQIVVEVFWTQGTQAAHNLTMRVESVGLGHQDVVFGEVVGTTGLKIVIGQTSAERFFPAGGTLRVSMASGPSLLEDESGLNAGLAFQQDFTIYVTTFYVEPGPNNYTASPNG